MPASFQGGFELPTEPSTSLDPDTRDWVARFLPGPEPERPLRAVAYGTESAGRAVSAPAAAGHHEPDGDEAEPIDDVPRAPRAAAAGYPRSSPRRRPASRPARRRGGGSPVLVVAVAAGFVAVTVLAARHYGWDALRHPWDMARHTAVSVDQPHRAATAPVAAIATPSPVENTAGATTAPAVASSPAAPKTQARAGARAAKPAQPAVTPTPSGEAASVPVAAAEPPAPPKRYGIEVGSYIFEDRAIEERDRLAATGYRVFMRTVGEGDSATFHLVLGVFSSRDEATAAAEALLGAGTIQQSRVLRLRGVN